MAVAVRASFAAADDDYRDAPGPLLPAIVEDWLTRCRVKKLRSITLPRTRGDRLSALFTASTASLS